MESSLAVNEDSQQTHDQLKLRIEACLAQWAPDANQQNDPVACAMRDSLLSGGKRVRPSLMVLAAQGLGETHERFYDLGCAIEMIHTASLILDDMPCMDNASLRRGRPAIHRHYGEDVAMLSAVALLSRAFGVVASIEGIAAPSRLCMIETLSRVAGMQGLVKGQYQDLREGARPRSPEAVVETNTLKTGVLFEAAMTLTALAANADAATTRSLKAFALALGQAFQLHDDLADGTVGGDKDVGQDRGKTTLIALLGADTVRQRLMEQRTSAERHLNDALGPGSALQHYVEYLFVRLEAQLVNVPHTY